MNMRLTLTLTVLLLQTGSSDAESVAAQEPNTQMTIENEFLGRLLTVVDGRLRTTSISNKMTGVTSTPTACDEFRLRISKGTHTTDTDRILTAADFEVVSSRTQVNDESRATTVSFQLESTEHKLKIAVHYVVAPKEFYIRKHLVITAGQETTLERVDVDALSFEDAHQPYKIKAIYARGKWSPGLGQPLFTLKSGAFWGVEFPAADNFVEDNRLNCGYLWGRTLKPGEEYTTYSAVMGVADNPEFITDAFFDYIDRIRIRPLRLQIQYNTWFDFGRGVNKTNFEGSIQLIHQKLATERGNRPLRNYVIDDGWQDTGVSWADKVWKVNGKFDQDFKHSREVTNRAGSDLGLWLSPGCLFGAGRAVGGLRRDGFEALDDWMSLAGPKYMQALQDRLVELTKLGVTYYKFDGLFGHLNTRNFELDGSRYGLPTMPQLDLEGISGNSAKLNESKYDELKTYYLVAGTERLIEMFTAMSHANPDVYLLISNGAYLSPWWLMHVDAIWMINAGDAAGGSDRTQELVYRDGRYYEIWQKEQTQFPLHSVFNHEPKKRQTGETKDVFRKYLYMNLSRGTGFIELYIKPAKLAEQDWDVLSEGLHWAYDVFPTFKRARMHGGDPTVGEAYGYSGWLKDQGYVSLHNPSKSERSYQFTLDRAFGLFPDSGQYFLTSPIAESVGDLEPKYEYGQTISVNLKPGEIRILNFDRQPKEWKVQRDLQQRTPESYKPPEPPKPLDIKNHPLVGVWEYIHQGQPYSREITADGFCILRQGKGEIWKKAVTSATKDTIMVGPYSHVVDAAGILTIEGRYKAKRAQTKEAHD